MPFPRKILLSSLLAAQCLMSGLPARAQAAIPAYFFKEWTVSANCAEQNSVLAGTVQTGLKFHIASSANADGSFSFVAENSQTQQWAPSWSTITLSYRPGTQMQTLPADFACIPGEPASSPFLAMSGYAVGAEPYYQQEHWYGLANIQGQLEHVLIFPRNVAGTPSVVIILQSVTAPGTVQLDDNGVIHGEY